MASLNKISLIGNLGRDPEVRDYQGTKVASFTLAVNEKYTKSNGEQIDKTEWFRVTFWGSTAEIVEKYLKKGSRVYVDGRLSTSEFLDKEGKNRVSLEVRGQNITLLGTSGGGSPVSESNNLSSSDENDNMVNNDPTKKDEDDLPF